MILRNTKTSFILDCAWRTD